MQILGIIRTFLVSMHPMHKDIPCYWQNFVNLEPILAHFLILNQGSVKFEPGLKVTLVSRVFACLISKTALLLLLVKNKPTTKKIKI